MLARAFLRGCRGLILPQVARACGRLADVVHHLWRFRRRISWTGKGRLTAEPMAPADWISHLRVPSDPVHADRGVSVAMQAGRLP